MKSCTHATCQGPTCRRPKKKPVRKPIAHFSKKRVKESKIYSALRKKFLEDNPTCAFPNCDKEATDVHHSRGRGKYLLDARTWKPLCRDHHSEIELKPLKAKELGLSESRLTLHQ